MATNNKTTGEIKMAVANDRVKTLIEKATCEFGGHGDVAYLEPAYYACNPNRDFGWDCNSVQKDGNLVRFGKTSWDFSENLEDASDYDWDDGDDLEFHPDETFDLSDDDDAEHVINTLNGWLKHV